MQSNITKTVFKISDFISWKRQGKLILSPDFQRRSVWKKGAKSFLIDTIVRGLPIPIIFIRDKRININDFEAIREVIDGQQRLRTIFSYISPDLLEDYDQASDQFTVSRSHNKEMALKNFPELSADIKEKILEYEFNVHILPTRMDDREVIQIFRRMNSTNYALKKQELRNAMWFGIFKTLAYDLSEEQLPRWRKWKTFTNDNIARMDEVEYVSECIILILEGGIMGKSNPKIEKYYKDYDRSFPSKNEVKRRFQIVMDVIDDLHSESKSSFVFVQQKIFYTFFAYIYDLIFGLKNKPNKKIKETLLSQKKTNYIYYLNQTLFDGTAPKAVLESSDRRTTNIKERKIIFKYLTTGK